MQDYSVPEEVIVKNKEEAKAAQKQFMQTIVLYYKKYWRLTVPIFFMMFVFAGTALLLPLITYQMTVSIRYYNFIPNDSSIKDVASAQQELLDKLTLGFWHLKWQGLTIIAVCLVIVFTMTSYVFDYMAFMVGRRIEIDLRNKSLEALVRQDISYYSDKKIGEILTKVISDTQIVSDQAVQVPMQFGISALELLAGTVMMFTFAWQVALVPFSMLLLILLAMLVAFAVTRKRVEKVREAITNINGDVTDRVATVRLIKATGTEQYETDRFKEVHKEFYRRAKFVGRAQAIMLTTLFAGVVVIQFSSVLASIIIFGVINPTPSYFDNNFAAFNLAQGILIGPLFQILNSLFGLAQASVAAKRVNDAIGAKSIMDPHYNDGIKIASIDGNIEFKNIEFRYPEKPQKVVLPKFDFVFEEGKSYAFVGETGSGKSTIAKLLLRFYDVSSGQIIINGEHDLRDLNLASYLYHIGYVEQDPQILYGDVYENIRYGRFNATDEEVIEAAKKAELHDLIQTWPDGYETILGERGFMLSGGQKQRLVIARMFLKNPKVLILDEATSALDNIVEKEIQAKLDDLMIGRTSVTIAHRLSTIKNVDKIIVLGANGAGIVQIGTFNELKNKPGHFQKLYKAGLMS
ncbi:ATP-binding cassette [Spiroplasma sp. TIUS-1]|uniref:ABC transporter ATP-binding protein n=1 Tax=Spiroplasma sp. TIUS-1 TaxID=216963 RepID=UPI0013995AE0|nr:ABC transporter ATP-binding protein [Spiroplasma sp. TIUS-1]QHX36092.1 ATP-binding cassette [Spiroplasma sp. TIUS-1]